jgi:hypothetical protein
MEKTMKMAQEMDSLSSIVNRLLDVDIHSKRRHRKLVEARMIFSKIMYDRGYELTSIGRFLGKNHSTIIHYIKASDYIFMSYPELHDKYVVCNEVFTEGKEPSMLFNRRDMVRSINNLNDRITLLMKERGIMRKREERIKRLENIIDLLEKKVPVGNENEAYRKINKVLNGGEIRERAGLAQGAESY